MEYVGIVLVMAIFVGTWRALNPRRRAHRRVRKAILARIFAESPAHQLEHLELVHSDGFYAFHADYIVIAENRLIPPHLAAAAARTSLYRRFGQR